jgi:curli biogenesis system outer membrane secretion channel CsgG
VLNRTVLIAVTAALAAVTPSTVSAQKLGQGGTGVDDTSTLPHCDTPLGVAALVEQKTANPTDSLSPQLQALMRMAQMQNGGSTANVDPLPLVKLMAARSGCFRVADRGDAFTALERERAIAGASAPARQITKADYLLQVQVVYSDAKSRESGGGVGGVFGGAVGLKSKTLESQVLLTLVDVDTGIQEAVASGSARKKDIGVVGGGLLLGLGVGALAGTYGSTDIGKITSLAMLDAYRKLITGAQPRLAARLRPAPQTLPAPATSQPAVPSTAPRR